MCFLLDKGAFQEEAEGRKEEQAGGYREAPGGVAVRKLRDLPCGTMAGTRQDYTVKGRRRGKKMGVAAILRAFTQTQEQTGSALRKGAALGLTHGGHRGTGFASIINPSQQLER